MPVIILKKPKTHRPYARGALVPWGPHARHPLEVTPNGSAKAAANKGNLLNQKPLLYNFYTHNANRPSAGRPSNAFQGLPDIRAPKSLQNLTNASSADPRRLSAFQSFGTLRPHGGLSRASPCKVAHVLIEYCDKAPAQTAKIDSSTGSGNLRWWQNETREGVKFGRMPAQAADGRIKQHTDSCFWVVIVYVLSRHITPAIPLSLQP